MGSYYGILSSLVQSVIDIQGNSTTPGALLDTYPQTNPLTDNQLWEFVPDPQGSGYYFIKSKLSGDVIEIQGGSHSTGALLDASPQKTTENANQLWQFFLDPDGSGDCFIMSKLNGNVIDIQNDSSQPKALLNSVPQTFPSAVHQLWRVLEGSFPTEVQQVPPPFWGNGLGSSNNYMLAQDCNPFVNPDPTDITCLVVTIDVTEDIIFKSTDGSIQGFSFQLNCYSPLKCLCAVQQYVIYLDGSDLKYDLNGWPASGPYLFNLGGKTMASLPSAMLPAGYKATITLLCDNNTGNILQANFGAWDNAGKQLANMAQSVTGVPGTTEADWAPMVAFQFDVVGGGGGESVVLSQGAGIITYWVPTRMTVLQNTPACVESSRFTGETANTIYSALPATKNNIYKQRFAARPVT